MSSIAYNTFLRDVALGNINVGADTFYAMIVGPGYTPSKNHSKRSDITNEVTGTGYTAGGKVSAVTMALDTVNNRLNFTLAGANWPASTVTGSKCVYYKHRGGAASADELVACDDFNGDLSSAGTAFLVNASVVRFQN
jgi:hypothetical protein